MLPEQIPPVEALPQRNATQVKKWAQLVRDVRAAGTMAVTSHDRVEVVLMDVETYRKMAALAGAAEERRQAALNELSAEFDRRLAVLQRPDAAGRVDAIMNAGGRSRRRPIAGSSY